MFQIYPSSLTLMVGQLFPLSIIAEDENGRKLGVLPVWNSSNTSSVFVSSSGVVKALAPGSATVTATYLDLTTWAVVNVLSPKEYAEYLSRMYQEYGTSATSGIATGGIPTGGEGITQPGYGGSVTIINQYVTYLTYSPGATDMLCDLNVCLTGYISRNFYYGDIQFQDLLTYGNYVILEGNSRIIRVHDGGISGRYYNFCHIIDLSDPDSPRYTESSKEICMLNVEGDKVYGAGISYLNPITTCSGDGLIASIPAECVDAVLVRNDGFPVNASGNSLEIYCCGGFARFCLSGESCPWRNGCVDTPETCSQGDSYLGWEANILCNEWNYISHYSCFSFDKRIRASTGISFFTYNIYSLYEKDGSLTLTYQGGVTKLRSGGQILVTHLSGDYLYSITSVEFSYSGDYPEPDTYQITYYLNVIDVENRTFVREIELSGLEIDIELSNTRYFTDAITVHTSPYMERAKLIKVGDKLYLIGVLKCHRWTNIFCRIPQLKGIPFVYSVFDVSNPADPKVLDAGVIGITLSEIGEGTIIRIGRMFDRPLFDDDYYIFYPVKVGDTIYIAFSSSVIVYNQMGENRVSLLFNFYYDSIGIKHNTIFEADDDWWYIVQQKPFHISGDRFYLNTSTSVVVFDVSSPRAPKLVNHIFPIQGGSIWVDSGKIYVYGKTYVPTYKYYYGEQAIYAPAPGSIGLQVFDLDGALKGLFRLPGMYGIVFAKGRNIYLMGSNLFLSLKYMRPE